MPARAAVSSSTTPVASDVADILIGCALLHRAATVWLEPLVDSRHRDAHRVSVERGQSVIASVVLGGGLGDAVVARLALMCELDLLARHSQSGRSAVRSGDHEFDLLVTTRPSERGLCAEVRILSSDPFAGQDAAMPQPAARLPEVLPSGTEVGPYRILGLLGHGGMGIVYRAEHSALRKPYAVKVLRHELMKNDPDSALRFVREARAAARIRDDRIVNVTDFGKLGDGRPYLVMELLSGRALEAITGEGAAPVQRTIELVRKIARALQAAHRCGVIHRDLTPSNIFIELIDQEERVKLVDFGAAHLAEPDLHNVPDGPPGIVLGTPYYMPPEQARGQETDERSDIYSLGVVFFELLSGQVPFDGESVREIVRHHVFTEPPIPFSPLEALPEELERAVLRCLRKDPNERFQTAGELIEELDRVERLLQRGGWRRWLPT